MKNRPVLLVAAVAMLFALAAMPSLASANQTNGNADGTLPIASVSQPVNFNPVRLQPLPPQMPALTVNAHIAIRLTSKDFWMTAEFGGGGTADPIHTDRPVSNGVGAWEVFTLEPQGGNVYAIKTASGNYLTATDGGGNVIDAIHANATAVGNWEKFALIPQSNGSFAIQTPNGANYITVAEGGGKGQDVLHTNATGAGSWEQFWLLLASPL